MDGAPACPFVAFGDDRDGRSTSPDHRHRCFAESPPAPRAVAHQEAYCLSSAFPVCPTFQDWARREAAHARGAGERPEAAPAAVASAAHDGSDAPDAPQLAQPSEDDEPVTRNPPRDWAAPPPWAMGATNPGVSGAGVSGAGATGTGATGPSAGATGPSAGSPSGTARPAGSSPATSEGQGLAGSTADRLAMGADAPGTIWSASAAGTVSTAPDDELAGLVQGRPGAEAPPDAGDYPPPTRTGRRPPVSSTRPTVEAIAGPTWERSRRSEAYPTIKTRSGLPSLPRMAALAGAVGIAALALFMLPALLGIGGGPASSAKPSATRPAATASAGPTAVPAPTPQVYIVKANDNLGKIAKKFGLTIDQVLAANPDITNPNVISLGQEIIIPARSPGPSPKSSVKPSVKPSASSAP